MKNTNIKIATLLALTAMTSCQKDYYLADLEAANAEIESLKLQVSDLIAQGNADSAEITKLNIEISNLEGDVAQLLLDLEAQNLLNESIQADLDKANDDLTAAHASIDDLNAQILQLNDDLTNEEITSAQYLELIAELEDDLAYEKANIKIVTEYITEVVEEIVVETQVVTQVVTEYVEVEAQAIKETPAVDTPKDDCDIEDGLYYQGEMINSQADLFEEIGGLDYFTFTVDGFSVDVTYKSITNCVETNQVITFVYDFNDDPEYLSTNGNDSLPGDKSWELDDNLVPVIVPACNDTEYVAFSSLANDLKDDNHKAFINVNAFFGDFDPNFSSEADGQIIYNETITQTKSVDCEDVSRDVVINVNYVHASKSVVITMTVNDEVVFTQNFV